MIGYFCKITLCSLSLVSTVWALPWGINKTSPVQEESPINKPDHFTGQWVGECDGKPAVDLKIKQDAKKLSIAYGFMEEHYVLGEIKSVGLTRLANSEHNNTFVDLTEDNRALVFINSNVFSGKSEGLNVFFSKVTMVLQEDLLKVNGQYYHTDMSVNGVEQDLISCIYRMKE